MRRFYLVSLFFALVVAAQPSVAAATAPYYVGTCRNPAFGTISAAVATVPSGSIIYVCPGTYPEQVIINQPLTLQGIFDSNSSQVIITMPSGGLATTSSILFGTIAAQVQVTAGPVNIGNITVDGTASSNCPIVSYSGIFYGSGSSGQVNEVETRHQNCNFTGVGIVAENTAGTAQTVTIENSIALDDSSSGIDACSDQTPSTLTANIKNNYVAPTPSTNSYGIVLDCNVAGTTSGNKIVGGSSVGGIYVHSASNLISGNTVTDAPIGIYLIRSATVSNNTVLNASYAGITVAAQGTVSSNGIWNSSNYGILLSGAYSATVKSNTLTNSLIGIEFSCSNDIVTNNTINGAGTGMDLVPATFNSPNKFNNVGTVRTGGC
jgi:parallel beta-helix repeat protein